MRTDYRTEAKTLCQAVNGNVERIESSYDARDRLLEEQVYDAATGGTLLDTIDYGYDANGSLMSRIGGGSSLTQTWDLRNRLSGAVADGVTTSYKYTLDGIRSSVTESGATTKYVIDGLSPSGYAQVVEELASGVLVVSYVYGASLDPISMNRDTNGSPSSLESNIYLADGHSGVRQAITAVGGAIFAAYRFDAFGNRVATAGTLTNPIGYRGERFDATLGLYSLRARFYDPRSGRFSQIDKQSVTLRAPRTVNRYEYVENDPLNELDPSGLVAVIPPVLGTSIHQFLVRTFEAQNLTSNFGNREVGTIAFRATGASIGRIRPRPDMVGLNRLTGTGDVYEIKHGDTMSSLVPSFQSARADALWYLGVLTARIPSVSWALGMSVWAGIVGWPQFQGHQLLFPNHTLVTFADYTNFPGAILYDLIPDPLWNKILDWVPYGIVALVPALQILAEREAILAALRGWGIWGTRTTNAGRRFGFASAGLSGIGVIAAFSFTGA